MCDWLWHIIALQRVLTIPKGIRAVYMGCVQCDALCTGMCGCLGKLSSMCHFMFSTLHNEILVQCVYIFHVSTINLMS